MSNIDAYRWTRKGARLLAAMLMLANCTAMIMTPRNGRDGKVHGMCAQSGIVGGGLYCGLDDSDVVMLAHVDRIEYNDASATTWALFTSIDIFKGKWRNDERVAMDVVDCGGLKIAEGEEWIVHLNYDKDEKVWRAYMGSSSLPAKNERALVERTRNLSHVKTHGVLYGHVGDDHFGETNTFESEGCTVTARNKKSGAEEQRVTGEDGRFIFESLPVGEYMLTATTKQGRVESLGEEDVVAGQCWMNFHMLHGGGIVRGRVLDGKGQPLSGGHILILPVDTQGQHFDVSSVKEQHANPDELARRQLTADDAKSADTDTNGAFTVYNLEPGEYVIELEPDTNSTGNPLAGETPIYAPGVRDRAKALRVTVSRETTSDVTLSLSWRSLRGRHGAKHRRTGMQVR